MMQILYYSLLTHDDWSFYIVSSNQGLCFVGSSPASKKEMKDWILTHFPEAELAEDDRALDPYRAEIIAYLNKEKQSLVFDTHLTGTPFQKKVWNSLNAIPYGETLTYSELASLIGYSPKAARAIGTALAANPLLIVNPCHRVVPKSSKPRAFRGGLAMKEKLLSLEQGAK
ncbi:hypothetical protein AX762_09750 [Alkalibacterium sp. 20]|nr:hypothetical protein AX762_09750 [Alkalibacterium sp. 20]